MDTRVHRWFNGHLAFSNLDKAKHESSMSLADMSAACGTRKRDTAIIKLAKKSNVEAPSQNILGEFSFFMCINQFFFRCGCFRDIPSMTWTKLLQRTKVRDSELGATQS